jgi:hypothetical protein
MKAKQENKLVIFPIEGTLMIIRESPKGTAWHFNSEVDKKPSIWIA